MADMTGWWLKQYLADMDSPNMSPNEQQASRAYHQKGFDRDTSLIRESNDRERLQTDARVEEHTTKAKAAMEELHDRVKAARAGRASTTDLAKLRHELLDYARFIEGDGKEGAESKWPGIKATYDSGYEHLDAIDADLGACADRLYEAYPSLAEGRYIVKP